MSIYLRTHHGMCFLFYKGVGYSEEFTDHIRKMRKHILITSLAAIMTAISGEINAVSDRKE